ncbi:BatD family protein [Teredinibacter haidensis]|uniref:BatD family protein n=1 Tax=Teredinibacter haidensis TaxID=2731755 RepID=UPI000948E5B7|nr:BatD family protein [Teredinibacter haidensis]
MQHSNFYKILSLFIISILLFGSGNIYAQTLTSKVDRNTISVDETLTLTVRYNGNTNGQPDFSLLSSAFEILNQSQSNQIRNINGNVESFTEWTMVIIPREEGRLIIPSFKFDGKFSEAIEIHVTQSTPVPAGMKDVVFIETLVDTESSYVQQQIKLTYRFYYSVNVDNLEQAPLKLDDAIIAPLQNSSYTKNFNNVLYRVAEYNYALFPQASGTLQIPSLRWTAKLSQSRNRNIWNQGTGRYELKRLKTDAKTIEVKPVPAAFPAGATWLPSSGITLTEHWNTDPANFKVGEPMTRKLAIQAQGLTSSQLPSIISEPQNSHIKFYGDKPELLDSDKADGIKSERIETVAVVVSQSGEVTIPSVRIPWWDTVSDNLKYAEIPEHTFYAEGNARVEENLSVRQEALGTPIQASAELQQASSTTTESPFWRWIAILAGFSTLVFAGLWLSTQRRIAKLQQQLKPQGKDSNLRSNLQEKQAWNQFEKMCVDNNLANVRSAVISWARTYWPNAGIHALGDIARNTDDLNVKSQLSALDHALFSSQANSQWNSNVLLAALKEWKKQQAGDLKKGNSSLKPLYKSS